MDRYVEQIPVDRYNVDYDYMAVQKSNVTKGPSYGGAVRGGYTDGYYDGGARAYSYDTYAPRIRRPYQYM